MTKWRSIPAALPSRRRMRAPMAWKVPIQIPVAPSCSSCSTRVRISRAALLVKVTAKISPGRARPCSINQAIRYVRTRVLPLPAVRCGGVLVAREAGGPYGFAYHLTWDAGWHVRTVDARLLGEERAPIQLRTDGTGHWLTAQGEDMAALAGCIDVDFTASPFTNTLPIRRLGLQVGQSARLLVVYILVPTLEIRPATQTYTRLDA